MLLVVPPHLFGDIEYRNFPIQSDFILFSLLHERKQKLSEQTLKVSPQKIPTPN